MKKWTLIAFAFLAFAAISCSHKEEASLPKDSYQIESVQQLLNDITFGEAIPGLKSGSGNCYAPQCTLTFNGDPNIVPLAGTYNGFWEIAGFFAEFFGRIQVNELQSLVLFGDPTGQNMHFRIQAYIPESGNSINLEFIYWLQFDANGYLANMVIHCDTYNLSNAFKTLGSPATFSDFESRFEGSIDLNPTGNTWELVQQGYQYFMTGDALGSLSLANPNVEWLFRGDTIHTPYCGNYQGTSGLIQYFTDLSKNYGLVEFNILDVCHQGNRVDVLVEEVMNTKPDYTGVEFTIYFTHSFVSENGKISSFVTTNDAELLSRMFQK